MVYHPIQAKNSGGMDWYNISSSVKTILWKIFRENLINQKKLGNTEKPWYFFFHIFWVLVPKINFSKGDLTLRYVLMQFWDFANISLFPKNLNFKSFVVNETFTKILQNS